MLESLSDMVFDLLANSRTFRRILFALLFVLLVYVWASWTAFGIWLGILAVLEALDVWRNGRKG